MQYGPYILITLCVAGVGILVRFLVAFWTDKPGVMGSANDVPVSNGRLPRLEDSNGARMMLTRQRYYSHWSALPVARVGTRPSTHVRPAATSRPRWQASPLKARTRGGSAYE